MEMKKLIHRQGLVNKINDALRRSRVVALLGPRQCGKTTLARIVAKTRPGEYFDLENPMSVNRLRNPMLTLESVRQLAIIDEIHRMPELFPVLRVLADRVPLPARFLLLGSASPNLLRHCSESLAGRIEFVNMSGFNLQEVGMNHFRDLWLKGRMPLSYQAGTLRDSFIWRENFVQTFVERDLRQMGVQISPTAIRRFWNMAAHYHGQIWHSSEIANSMGISNMTVRRHLDMMTDAYMIRQLPPWHENLGKRQVKASKVYIRDSGLLHVLLRLHKMSDVEEHPKYGFSWEGFVIEEILDQIGERDGYFWATHGGAELDLLICHNGKKWGFECKCSDAPALSKAMHIVINDLCLQRLFIVYPGTKSYRIHEKAEIVSILDLHKCLQTILQS